MKVAIVAADQTEQVSPRLIRLDAGDKAVAVGDKAVAADGEIVVHDASLNKKEGEASPPGKTPPMGWCD